MYERIYERFALPRPNFLDCKRPVVDQRRTPKSALLCLRYPPTRPPTQAGRIWLCCVTSSLGNTYIGHVNFMLFVSFFHRLLDNVNVVSVAKWT